MKQRNFVAKYAAEFCKPKVERDRKKNPSKKQRAQELAEQYVERDSRKTKLAPYVRDHHNYLLDGDDD